MKKIEYNQVQKILEMICERENGIEFFFNLHNTDYSIYKNTNFVIFRKHIGKSKNIELKFENFDELYNTKLIDDILLCDEWQYINTWYCDYIDSEDENISISEQIDNLQKYIEKEKEARGNMIFEFRPSKIHITKYMLKYVSIGPVIFLLLSIIPPLTGGSNWNLVLLVLGIDIFTLATAVIFGLKSNYNMCYIITDKKIIKIMGASVFETDYSNIKSIKMKKKFFNKNKGTIKIFVYKGISLNYHLVGLEDIKKIYDLINIYIDNKII